jgi:hypothetical protein
MKTRLLIVELNEMKDAEGREPGDDYLLADFGEEDGYLVSLTSDGIHSMAAIAREIPWTPVQLATALQTVIEAGGIEKIREEAYGLGYSAAQLELVRTLR